MKKIFENIFYNNGQICIYGDFLPWYNENEDCLQDRINSLCSIKFVNLEMLSIDSDGVYLDLPRDWDKNNTWCIYEQNISCMCYNYINSSILKNKIIIEKPEIHLNGDYNFMNILNKIKNVLPADKFKDLDSKITENLRFIDFLALAEKYVTIDY